MDIDKDIGKKTEENLVIGIYDLMLKIIGPYADEINKNLNASDYDKLDAGDKSAIQRATEGQKAIFVIASESVKIEKTQNTAMATAVSDIITLLKLVDSIKENGLTQSAETTDALRVIRSNEKLCDEAILDKVKPFFKDVKLAASYRSQTALTRQSRVDYTAIFSKGKVRGSASKLRIEIDEKEVVPEAIETTEETQDDLNIVENKEELECKSKGALSGEPNIKKNENLDNKKDPQGSPSSLEIWRKKIDLQKNKSPLSPTGFNGLGR